MSWTIVVPLGERASQTLPWEWDAPSLQDETDFYTDVMGWTIPGTEPGFAATFTDSYVWYAPTSWGFGNIHNDTEGDDLWAWDQQYKRYGGSFVVSGTDTTDDWRTELLADFKDNLLSALDASEDTNYYDHMYGLGLATIYNDTGDSEILTVFAGLKTRIESTSNYQLLDNETPVAMAYWEGRYIGRPALTSAYISEATGDGGWIAIRNSYAFGYETATDWEEGGNIQAGGMMFASRAQAAGTGGSGGTDYYDAGYRFHSTFQIGIMAEAMWRLYVQTGSAILRARLIKMARYVKYYAHDPSWDYPNVGSRFGHEPDGSRWWLRTEADGTAANADTNCSYDMSLVNLMVIGYKLTGETAMWNFAKTLFARGNRYLPGSPYAFRASSQNHVLKYVDTTPNPDRVYFLWNKGALQYCYQLFENGGLPQTESPGPLETLAATMSSGEWAQVTTTTGLQGLLDDYYPLTESEIRSFLEYDANAYVYKATGEIHHVGSGHASPAVHIKYSEATGAWTLVENIPTALTAWAHTYDGFDIDQATGDFYSTWTGAVLGGGDEDGNWAEIADRSGGEVIDGGAWFPDLNGGVGGYVILTVKNGPGALHKYVPGSGWSLIDSDATPTYGGSNYHNSCVYLPYQKVLMVGGGNGAVDMVELDADENLTTKEDTPGPWQPGSPPDNVGAIVAFENGRVLYFGISFDQIHEYTYATDTWSFVSNFPEAISDRLELVPCAIDSIGAVLVLSQESPTDPIEEWLYKI